MATKFLLVGLASDGPSNVVYKLENEKQLKEWFGHSYTERYYASTTASSVVLTYLPWKTPINEVDSRKNYLFAPYMDRTNTRQVNFGAIGGSATHTVDMTYTPYLGEQDLLIATRRFIAETGQLPYVIRIGGNKAEVVFGDWEFEAKYAGYKYNYVGLSSNGSSLTIFGLEPNFATRTYSYTTYSTAKQLAEAINRDFNMGTIPVVCTLAGSALIPSNTYWFTGGTDGSFSDADFTTFMDTLTVPIDVSHVVLLTDLTSSMVASIADYISEVVHPPKMYLTQAPAFFGTGGASAWLQQMETTLPSRHNMIASFIGTVSVDFDGIQLDRYALEGATIAFANEEGYNLTNIPVEANDFYPVLDEENLIAVKNAGFIPMMRYIRNDISIYEGTTTYGENSFLYSSKVAEIYATAYDYCFQYFGTIIPDGDQPDMARELFNKLSSISFITMENVKIYKKGEEMFIRIEAILPEEILRISFTIKNK